MVPVLRGEMLVDQAHVSLGSPFSTIFCLPSIISYYVLSPQWFINTICQQ